MCIRDRCIRRCADSEVARVPCWCHEHAAGGAMKAAPQTAKCVTGKSPRAMGCSSSWTWWAKIPTGY
eukprot:440332-Prymnesium_polylepis.1